MVKNVIVSLLMLVSFSSLSQSLDLQRGITLEVLNEALFTDEEKPIFIDGENQLVLTFAGRLKKVAKPEYFSSLPYVIRTEIKAGDKLSVELVSGRYEVIQEKQFKSEPIFVLKKNEVEVTDSNSKQYRLEPENGSLMPYSDIRSLTIKQNRKEGVIFESGKFHHLTDELKSLGTSTQSTKYTESEAALQLKIWFSKASKEERREFLDWVVQGLYTE
ncbi:DUF2057 domain-containing protein [Vibrio anguillarum]|nr:DUF2057 family protein [Vibrio anguillarum]MCC4237532.1 DUF2057 domain-containing protein [Vibrio anguillarum]MDT3846118.1 DUF2057 family protein [Vibrio anguillarum]NOI03908.1 DUF2057 domain-containing protein [Vibrio anguillarum]